MANAIVEPPATMPSPISGYPAEHAFTNNVLGRYPAHYYFDREAGFIFVSSPYWLDEAYKSPIVTLDTGVMVRNMHFVNVLSPVLDRPAFRGHRIVDVGGGYGIFVRMMRDRGHDAFWADPYAENLLARGFEATSKGYEVATCFEVLEHTEKPPNFLNDLITTYSPDLIIFSTELFDGINVPPRDWWYYGFDSGQHISFYSAKTLTALASAIRFKWVRIHSGIYAFYRSNIDKSDLVPQRHWRLFAERLGLIRRQTPLSGAMRDHIFLRDRVMRETWRSREASVGDGEAVDSCALAGSENETRS